MCVALQVDHIAAFSEEFAVLTWVLNLGQSVPVCFHCVHSLLDLREGSKLVEDELLCLNLLRGNFGQVLARGRILSDSASSSEIFLHMWIEAVEERLEG